MTARVAAGVVVGSLIGAGLRWGLTDGWSAHSGLLVANVVGCVVMGAAVARTPAPPWLTFGLCGALTSFSALALQLAIDLDQGDWLAAGWWLAATLLGCALAFVAGGRLGRRAAGPSGP